MSGSFGGAPSADVSPPSPEDAPPLDPVWLPDDPPFDPTPPLDARTSGPFRVRELATRVGAR